MYYLGKRFKNKSFSQKVFYKSLIDIAIKIDFLVGKTIVNTWMKFGISLYKKEITFSGDVLNTTARSQSLCNTYKTDILAAGRLVQLLQWDSSLNFTSLGIAELSGRDKTEELFTVAHALQS